jgi:hypothetical protein
VKKNAGADKPKLIAYISFCDCSRSPGAKGTLLLVARMKGITSEFTVLPASLSPFTALTNSTRLVSEDTRWHG